VDSESHGEVNPVRGELSAKLRRALSKIDRPGSFCTSGSAPAVLPGLEVKGLGPVGLPLAASQAKELKKHCHQAPYGKGTETVVDPKVRRVWRMEPDRFSLTNPDWTRFIAETVARVQEGLGLEKQQLKSHLYDLLLYEPGGFFLPHRDGEKLDRMVATLVIVLPSSYEGGELVVRHDGQERTIDFGDPDDRPFHSHFAAFYADCEHEIRPLRKGYRLCLVYNLSLAKSKKTKAVAAPRASEHIEEVRTILREWTADDSARKLAITLDHQYTQDGLSWDTLKGVDRAKAQVLDEAAREAGCEVYLALLTFWESGSAEEDDYGGGSGYGYGRRRYWDDEEEDEEEDEDDDDDDQDIAGEYTMEEVFDSRLTAKNWIDREGNTLPIGELNVGEDELLDRAALTKVKPEEEYEGFTGNEGMTLERWYRHAAIILWPAKRRFEVICDVDSRNVVPELKQMVARWRQSRGDAAAALKAQCLELAAAILAKWPEAGPYGRFRPEGPAAGDLLETLDTLDDPGLIGDFLGGVLVRDVSVEPGKSLVAIGQRHGWGTFQRQLLAVMKGTTQGSMERNVRLLELIATARPRKKEGWAELVAAIAQELVAAIEALDRRSSSTDWQYREVKRAEILEGLARSLIAADRRDVLSRFVDHALALPKRYPLRTAHLAALAALRPWLKKHVKQPIAALTHWLASCREQLEALTAQVPQEPTDFRRSAAIGCKCAECAELSRFLKDPKESVHRFSAREERRKHLEHRIREHRCDLDLKTERRGSPYTLVCTKNTASYRAKLKTYHEDLEHLAMVRAIESGLPK
jgi:hypothetical protein